MAAKKFLLSSREYQDLSAKVQVLAKSVTQLQQIVMMLADPPPSQPPEDCTIVEEVLGG